MELIDTEFGNQDREVDAAEFQRALEGFESWNALVAKLYLASEAGTVTVVRAGAQWEVLATNDLGEECYATPALGDGRIYLRTVSALYCFTR